MLALYLNLSAGARVAGFIYKADLFLKCCFDFIQAIQQLLARQHANHSLSFLKENVKLLQSI